MNTLWNRRIFRASFVALLFVSSWASVTGQVEARENPTLGPALSHSAIYGEFLGQGLLYSINYDYRISDHYGLRAGFSSWSMPSIMLFVNGSFSFTGFPIMLYYLSGDGSSHLELGVGIVPSTVSVTGHEIFLGSDISGSASVLLETATIGYRLQPRDGGFLFRIGLTPLMSSGSVQLSGGLSIGAAF